MKQLAYKLSHPLIAVGLQILLGIITGNFWLGALGGSALFIGRELAQAEYRWIERFGYQSPAEYAEWHYRTFGQAEGRPPLASWDEYFAANPDLQDEFAKLTGLRAKMPWWGGFDPRVWDTHSVLGFVLPLVGSVVLAAVLS
jgi:hypothetical protein